MSHARRGGRPTKNVLYTDHADAKEVVDRGYYVSGDGSRVTEVAPSPKKQRCVLPQDLEDEYTNWIPGEDLFNNLGQSGDEAEQQKSGGNGEKEDGDKTDKADKQKCYMSSVSHLPMSHQILMKYAPG